MTVFFLECYKNNVLKSKSGSNATNSSNSMSKVESSLDDPKGNTDAHKPSNERDSTRRYCGISEKFMYVGVACALHKLK